MFTKVKSGVSTAEDTDLFQALVGGFEGASSSATISLNMQVAESDVIIQLRSVEKQWS
jgi:hypothetical protein